MPKILLVEDDNNLREIYGARLMAEGYDIISASDGEEALATAVKEKPDLIISDVMMPRISGFDMLDILRNAPETKDTKVIMMTALSQAEDKERADKLGADLYLVKSQVTLEDVTKSVHEILGDNPAETTEEVAPDPVTPVEPPAAPQLSTPDPVPPPPTPEPPAVPAPTAPAPEQVTPVEPPAAPQLSTPDPVPPPPTPEPPAVPAPTAPAPEPVTIAVAEAPAPTPIEVVLPDSDDEVKTSEDAAAKAAEEKEAAPQEIQIDSSVGPNLSEALNAESGPVDAPTEQPTETKAPEIVIESPEAPKAEEKPAEPIEEKKEAEDDSAPKTAQPKEVGGQRVIHPSEDFLKGGPNIDDLLAKEEEKAAIPIPDPNTVLAPPVEEKPAEPAPLAPQPVESNPKNEDIDKIAI